MPLTMPSGMTLLSAGSVAAAATLDLSLVSVARGFRGVRLVLIDFVPATDTANLTLRTSQDGTTYDTGGTDYAYANIETYVSGSNLINSGGASSILLQTNNGSSATLGGTSGFIDLFGHTKTAQHRKITYQFECAASAAGLLSSFGGGRRLTAAAVGGLRLLYSSGNITSGDYALYGYA